MRGKTKSLCSEKGLWIYRKAAQRTENGKRNERDREGDRRQDRALRRKRPRGALYGGRHRERYGNMTVSGKCQFDEDGKVSFIELDTNELEMTLIANDNADPTQKPPANGNAITLNE